MASKKDEYRDKSIKSWVRKGKFHFFMRQSKGANALYIESHPKSTTSKNRNPTVVR
jgi:hypothetical protein